MCAKGAAGVGFCSAWVSAAAASRAASVDEVWGLGHVTVVGGKLNSVGNLFSGCFCDIHAVAVIVLWGSSKVPSVDAMCIPSLTVGCFFVNDNTGAGGCKWSLVVVEGAVELCFGG